MVISAPTGSGKTVLFELCILRLLSKFISEDGRFIHIKGTLKTVSFLYQDTIVDVFVSTLEYAKKCISSIWTSNMIVDSFTEILFTFALIICFQFLVCLTMIWAPIPNL